MGAANADDGLSATVTYEEVRAQAGDGSSGRGGSTAPRRPRLCEVYEAPSGPGGGASSENSALQAATGVVEGEWYYSNCFYTDTGEVFRSEYWRASPNDPVNPGPSLEALARQAYDEVPLAYPVPQTSPSIDIEQITGLPTWLWIDSADWQPLSARAELAGFFVEVTAEPQSVTWVLGDGTVVDCDGPGTPYNPAIADDAQHTDCQHVYQHVSADEPGGQYAASVTVAWSVSWDASTGATGVLADATRTTSFGLTVTERQAVVTYGT